MEIHSRAAASLWGRNLFGQATGVKASAPTGTGMFFANVGTDSDDEVTGKDTVKSTAPPLKPAISIPGTSTATAGFYTQNIAQDKTVEQSASLDKTAGPSVEDTFMDFVHKNPMERLRDQIMHEMGVTEDQIKNMSPEDQAELEEKIREKIQEALKKKMDNAAAKDPSDTTLATMAAAI